MAKIKKTVGEQYVDETNTLQWREVEIEIEEEEDFHLDKLRAKGYKRLSGGNNGKE